MSVQWSVFKFFLCCEDTKVVCHRFNRMCTTLKEMYQRLTVISTQLNFYENLNINLFSFFDNLQKVLPSVSQP
jgi:hypothetical protein